MPIASSDLKYYAAANMPENDTATSGGAIAPLALVEFTDVAANDALEALSSSAADTMTLTVTGRNAGGAIVSEAKALTGVSVISLTTLGTIERVMKVVLASAAAGTVTVRRASAGATVIAIPIGKTSTRRMFYDAASEAGSTTRYEKLFAKNEHGTLTLTNASIKLTADPAATIRIAGAPTKDDTVSVANRKTLPGSLTFVDDGVLQSIVGNTLEAGTAIGVWVEMARGAGAAAIKNTFTVEVAGTTT